MNDFYKIIRGFLTEFLPKQKGCSVNTIKSYKYALNLLLQYMQEEKKLRIPQINFAVLDREVILGFLDWLEMHRKCGALSRNQRLAVLRSFLKYAGLRDCSLMELSLTVAAIPQKKSAGKTVNFLSETALADLLKQPDTSKRIGIRDQFFLILMYDTAARCGELLNLKLSDLRLYDVHPTVYLTGKGNKTRIVPLMPKTAEHCIRYLKMFHSDAIPKEAGYIFYTIAHGERRQMSADAVAIFMKKYGTMATITCPEMPKHLHPHMLRHTRAIHLYRNGMPLALLSDFLGHASTKSTSIYAYADSEMKRAIMQKAEDLRSSDVPSSEPIWLDDDDMILKLSGLR